MSQEPLRIRVLDALELGPATVEQLALMLGSKAGTLRTTCRLLELDGLLEKIATVPAKNPHHTGNPWKVYAIKGSTQGTAVNAQTRRVA